MLYVAALNVDSGNGVYFSKKAQIAYLKADEASIKVFSEYADFINVFSLKLAVKVSKYTKINNHAIKLVDNWQPPYGLIYSLEPVELETLKTYIKNNLANSFIKPSKFLAGISIFFNKKLNESLKFYVDYCNSTI